MNAHPLGITFPSIRLPVTICVLAYGPHASLAKRFLTSLYRNTNPRLFSLRAGLNEAEPATRELFRDFAGRFNNITVINQETNIFKSPMMRRLFQEPALDTRWIIWCDDDTHFTRPDWLHRLAFHIENAPNVAMWGKVYSLYSGNPLVPEWIKRAEWYRGLPCLRRNNPEGQDAAFFRFAAGAFWALRTEVIRFLNWPDPRLIHANEDFMLGEALRQNQLHLGHFTHGVKVNDETRRNGEAIEAEELRG
ncbi:MAG TPA: glycosyltransferase family A protein [Verrucomicrobiae bacterium]|jgi:GT2 family glycosyltransferase